MYNQMIQNFIQINNNLCESKKLWDCGTNEILIVGYPFLNSFDEVILAMYDLRDEEKELRHAAVKEMRYNTKEEALNALKQALNILFEINKSNEHREMFNNRSKKCAVTFTPFLGKGNSLERFIQAYRSWISEIAIRELESEYLVDDVSAVEWLDSVLANKSDALHDLAHALSDEELTEFLAWAGSDDWYVKEYKLICAEDDL